MKKLIRKYLKNIGNKCLVSLSILLCLAISSPTIVNSTIPDVPVLKLINTITEQRFNGEVYWILDTNEATVHWDPVVHPDLSHYEIQIVWMDKNQAYPIVTTTDTEYTFLAPRVGHFIIMVRAVNTQGEYSDWADSSIKEYAMVDGVHMSWIIYFKMTPPSWDTITF